ncbi:MAG: HIT family protein [Nocardioidaceae bacterium]
MSTFGPGWPDVAHVLVIPRLHVSQVDALSDEVTAGLMKAVVRAAYVVRAEFNPAGISVWQSNGEAAGQEVQDVHMHVLTRRRGDGLLRVYPSAPAKPSRQERAALADRLRASL